MADEANGTTPTPWQHRGKLVYARTPGLRRVAMAEDEAHAAEIVRAANSHDDLLASLREVEGEGVLYAWANERGISRDEWKRRGELIDRLRAAIAKALERQPRTEPRAGTGCPRAARGRGGEMKTKTL